MARSGRVIVPTVLVLGALVYLASQGPAFVPNPIGKRASAAAAPAALALLSATPAFADEIGAAASKLTDKAYPLLQDINWFSTLALTKPGTASAGEWVKAIDKAIVMGSAMDPVLLKKAVEAHHAAISGVSSTGNDVTGKADFEQINAALGRAIASVPTAKTMDVYNAFKGLVSPEVPKYLMSTVKEADAKAAYAALMDFKDVVKKNSVKAAEPVSSISSTAAAKIDSAAEKLSSAAYPLLKDVDWTSDLALKPLPGASPLQVLRAIDKALVMGAAMDSAALKEAADAHHKAIGSVDAKLVTSASDFQAINAGLGKAIASVPTSTVMDVYNAFAGIVSPTIPNYLYSSVSANDATAAYNALLEFKDVVKAAR